MNIAATLERTVTPEEFDAIWPRGDLPSTDSRWKPSSNVEPLLAFSGELLVGVAQSHPCWMQADSARVVAKIVLGRKHGRS